MITDYTAAIDEISGFFYQDWNSVKTSAIVGYVPEIRWQNIELPSVPDASKFWCRFSTQSVFEEQTTLSNCAGEPGKKRFTLSGLVFIQLFCPKSNARANELGQKLAEVAKKTFRGKATENKIWFRNVRINDLEPENLYYRFNVVAEFEYDEMG
jgi:hypothetical protein